MSSALGRACSGAARRLAASQQLGGAFAAQRAASSLPADRPRGSGGAGPAVDSEQWKRLQEAGEKINPCNSPLHPAVKAGTLPLPGSAPRLSVQAAYDPRGMCFGCGASRRVAAGRNPRAAVRSQRQPFGQPFTRGAAARRAGAPRRLAHVVVSHRDGAADGGVRARQVPGALASAASQAHEPRRDSCESC
jgi:hypothetical protein